MTIEEYFGDWANVIDLNQADSIIKRLSTSREIVCPRLKDVFKAFKLCSLSNLTVVVIGMDPYPNLINGKPVATGIAFANSSDTPEFRYSPSLKVLKESVIDYTIPHGIINFDPTLEEWERQGVLLINSALSCTLGRTGSHSLLWLPFIKSFLIKLSTSVKGIVYVLLGSNAKDLRSCIQEDGNLVLCENHPSYYARTKTRMPSRIWAEVNEFLLKQYNYKIEWFKEERYE